MSSAVSGAGSGMYLLDSSVLIRSLRGASAIRARLAGTTALYIPSVALGELYVGAFGSPTRTEDALRDIDALAAGMTILAVDVTTAQIYGASGMTSKQRGWLCPPMTCGSLQPASSMD